MRGSDLRPDQPPSPGVRATCSPHVATNGSKVASEGARFRVSSWTLPIDDAASGRIAKLSNQRRLLSLRDSRARKNVETWDIPASPGQARIPCHDLPGWRMRISWRSFGSSRAPARGWNLGDRVVSDHAHCSPNGVGSCGAVRRVIRLSRAFQPTVFLGFSRGLCRGHGGGCCVDAIRPDQGANAP